MKFSLFKNGVVEAIFKISFKYLLISTKLLMCFSKCPSKYDQPNLNFDNDKMTKKIMKIKFNEIE